MSPAAAAPPFVLTIAGSDSCGGAGIQADLRTFHAFGLRGACAVTALTAQEPSAVAGVLEVAPAFVLLQARTVTEALPVAAIKTGMLANAGIVSAVAGFLRDLRGARGDSAPKLVVDPVMVAASGARLLDDDACDVLRTGLLPLADVVTPNLPEAARLIGEDPLEGPRWPREKQAEAARAILALGPRAVLVKGGHRVEGPAADVLAVAGRDVWLEAARVPARSTHGTGCTLSAAIASCLARGDTLEAAVRRAKDHLTVALARGLDLPHS
jgi:hydroxymethylpyrimidine/phosphomethylpyrimidine kinase